MNLIKRTFIPGDEWVYIKIYTGYKTGDLFLVEDLPIIIKSLKKANIIDKWFFIRYRDPHYHLRLRFHIRTPEYISQLILILNDIIKPYVTQNLIWNIQIDTYQRELERYGDNTIDHAETIFYADSETSINILSNLIGLHLDQRRWLLAFRLIDVLLDDFRLTINEKSELLKQLTESYKQEFGYARKESQIQLDKKFRENRKDIYDMMTNFLDTTNWASPFHFELENRSKIIKVIADDLIKLESEKLLKIPVSDLLRSYIHMMLNRFFRSKQRVYELFIYEMLYRHYSSEIAKAKNIENNLKKGKAYINNEIEIKNIAI